MNAFEWLGSDNSARLTLACLHFLWQGCLVAVAVSAARAMMPKASANARYLVDVAALTLMAACLPLTFALVEIPATDATPRTSQLAQSLNANAAAQSVNFTASNPSPLGSKSVGRLDSQANETAEIAELGSAGLESPLQADRPHMNQDGAAVPNRSNAQGSPTSGATESTANRSRAWARSAAPFVSAAYLLGLAVMLFRLIRSLQGGRRLRLSARPIVDERLLAMLRRQAKRLGMRIIPVIDWSENVSIPIVVGIIKPSILLPAALGTGLTPAQLEAVLAHELAHVRRFDLWVHLIQLLIETALFFHPAVWYVSRLASRDREDACDDMALSAGWGRLQYADALVAAAELAMKLQGRPKRELTAALGVEGESPSHFKQRILRLLDAAEPPRLCLSRATLVAMSFLLASTFVLATLLPPLAMNTSVVASEPAPPSTESTAAPSVEPAPTDPLQAIIAAVREQEKRYRRLETVVRREWHSDPKKWRVATRRRIVHAIRQPDRLYVEGRTEREFGDGRRATERFESAFDGTTTTVVDHERGANRFSGYYEPARVFAPHAWGLFHLEVNFPLSVFLEGTDAMKKHPKVRRFPRERGSVFEFYRVECESLGREMVEGLQCEKIRVRRWYYTSDPANIWYLWLAPSRNYLCVKAVTTTKIKRKEVVNSEAVVSELREMADGLWLPERVEVTYFDYQALRRGKRKPSYTRELRLESAKLNPHYGDRRFKLDVPKGLPVYSIDAGRLVDDPRHPRPVNSERSTTLAKIIEGIRRGEREFENYALNVTETYRDFDVDYGTVDGRFLVKSDSVDRSRSVARGDLKYFCQESSSGYVDGTSKIRKQIEASDGRWKRNVSFAKKADRDEWTVTWANLAKVGNKKSRIKRPHTLILDTDSLPLSEYLVSEWSDKHNQYRHAIVYEGDEMVDGLNCHKLREELHPDIKKKYRSCRYIWIARDRHYIPVRSQWLHTSWHPTLPTGIHVVQKWTNDESGGWLPVHWTDTAFVNFDQEGLADSRLIPNWRRESHVTEFSLDPQVDESLFAGPSVPKGTRVELIDADGTFIGRIKQPEDGPLRVDPHRWKEMLATAEKSKREQQRIRAVMDGLIGKPAPPFPESAWLNGRPLTWKDLKGKVVVLDFWAWWCGPCSDDLERLSEVHQHYQDKEITDHVIIGIHTAEANHEFVRSTAKGNKIQYPVYIDRPDKSKKGWGQLYNLYGVHSIPVTFVVDRQGKVVAYGRLEEMLSKASQVAERQKVD